MKIGSRAIFLLVYVATLFTFTQYTEAKHVRVCCGFVSNWSGKKKEVLNFSNAGHGCGPLNMATCLKKSKAREICKNAHGGFAQDEKTEAKWWRPGHIGVHGGNC